MLGIAFDVLLHYNLNCIFDCLVAWLAMRLNVFSLPLEGHSNVATRVSHTGKIEGLLRNANGASK